MVEIEVRDDRLRFEIRGLHKLWAFRWAIEVPREAVRAVRRAPAGATQGLWKGWRIPGTHLPGVIVAGTFYKDGERHFWDVRRADRAIEIELEGARYDRLFIEVADPEAAMRALEHR